jgi:hypothetical protein
MTTTPGYTVDALATAIVRDVAELPDRTSPDDQPEMMLVTSDELRNIILARAAELTQVTAQSVERASPAKDGGEQPAWHSPQVVREGADGEFVFVEWLQQDWQHRIRFEVCDENTAADLIEGLANCVMSVSVQSRSEIIAEVTTPVAWNMLGWARYNDGGFPHFCDVEDEGAFRVYAVNPAPSQPLASQMPEDISISFGGSTHTMTAEEWLKRARAFLKDEGLQPKVTDADIEIAQNAWMKAVGGLSYYWNEEGMRAALESFAEPQPPQGEG